MTSEYILELPEPAFPREVLDVILLSAIHTATARPGYYAVDSINTVGYLYLVNPEHDAHDSASLEPLLCTLAYDSERNCYLVVPHGAGCGAHLEAFNLYNDLCDEHRDGAA